VLMNLCTNAWHALPNGSGTIDVRLASLRVGGVAAVAPPARTHLAEGAYAHLSVTDSGRGMNAATRARIFEPFFTTKPAGQGTGLGLSVVHGIVGSYGGTITVSSRLGAGSRFDIYIPQLEGGTGLAAPEATAPPPAPGRGEHVLYIDDDEVMLLMVEHLLLKLGYSATCLIDPRAALAAVQARPGHFDLVVTDFNMPQMSGLDLARALRDIDAHLPVVISSGYLPEQLRSNAEAAGVVALMRKEHTLDDLGAVVERALSARHAAHPPAPG